MLSTDVAENVKVLTPSMLQQYTDSTGVYAGSVPTMHTKDANAHHYVAHFRFLNRMSARGSGMMFNPKQTFSGREPSPGSLMS